MIYSLETKRKVVKQIRQGMKIQDAVTTYGISRSAIREWLKSPENHHAYTSLEEKVRILNLIVSGSLSVRQAAELNNINHHTVREWVRDKDRIFALYSSQGQSPVNTGYMLSPREEVPVMSTTDDKDTKQHLRDLKAENEFLKAKVAYLEALMEFSGTPASGFKKKSGIRLSAKSSEKGSEE